MNALKTLAVALATALSAACAANSQKTAGTGTEILRPEQEKTTVRVENRNWSDVTVYAILGGQRQRLGTVNSMGSASFRVPSHFLAAGRDLQLLVDPVGSSEEYMSPAMQVYSGQEVSLSVQNHLSVSSVAIFRGRR